MKTLKIVVLLVLTALFFQDANAQIVRNSFIIGGNMNFSSASGEIRTDSRTNTKPSSFNFAINPKIGYFIVDNFAVGLDLNFQANSVIDPADTSEFPTSTYTQTTLLTGPFVRYYFGLSESAFLFLEGSFGFGLNASKVPGPNGVNDVSIRVLNAGIGPGMAFFLNDFIAVEGVAKYTYANSSFTANNSTTTDISNLINFNLGFQFYFRAVEGGRQ